MLYPQYKHQFEKTISEDTWKFLQNKAAEEIASKELLHKDVRKHMQSIIDGKIPFGYKIKEED